jgi:metal-sulfur cluster biosynthetic enzyme
MNDKPKENANPKIIDVKKGPSQSRPESEIWSSINRMSCGVGHADVENDSHAHNRSILKALQDTSDATEGRSISLLRNSGLVLQQGEHAATRISSFHFPIQFSACRTDFDAPGLERQLVHQEKIDEDEVFDIIRNIQDPEHPLTLEQLGVVSRKQIEVKEIPSIQGYSTVDVRFTPTIPHCSMATLIGLSIRVKLLRSLPSIDRFKVTVRIEPGTHNSELAVNKQLSDKERVCAALENKHLLGLVNKCILSGMRLPNYLKPYLQSKQNVSIVRKSSQCLQMTIFVHCNSRINCR